ncbi:MAG: hypothetical protein ACREEM_14890 [Blastocatellia bacterium]
MKRLLRFYKYLFAWENYLLLARAVTAGRLVRRHLNDWSPAPNLAPSIQASDRSARAVPTCLRFAAA